MTPNLFEEASRQIPLVNQCDVIVCGAGPAGIAAALSAARNGAKTYLIEAHGSLGGVWTSGLLTWILDAGNKGGIMREITCMLQHRQAYSPKNGAYAYDPEEMKILLEELCIRAGVHFRLHTRVTAAYRDQNNRLSTIVTESKSGREAWQANVFIDASGDGDLAAQAGCGFDLGRESDGESQPLTLMALLTGINADEIAPFVGGNDPKAKSALFAALQEAGHTSSYSAPTLFRIRDNLFAFSGNHQYGVSASDADQLTKATVSARSEIHQQVKALRSLGGPWKNLKIVATADQIGVREGRRIHGHYTVSIKDALEGVRHRDAVCRVTFGIDVHSTNPKHTSGYSGECRQRARPYDIPLRALIARDVDALMMAGRCISGDFLAHASYRVTGNAVSLGEAAGTVAALATQSNCLPQNVSWDKVQQVMGDLLPVD
jgi:hypothetical protein